MMSTFCIVFVRTISFAIYFILVRSIFHYVGSIVSRIAFSIFFSCSYDIVNRARLELLYLDIQDSFKEESHWSNWFDENKETLEIEKILENAELLKFVFDGYKMRKKHIKPYTEYIKTINAIIEARGKVLAEKLMKKP